MKRPRGGCGRQTFGGFPGEPPPTRSRVRPTPTSVPTKAGFREEKAPLSVLGFSRPGPRTPPSADRRPLRCLAQGSRWAPQPRPALPRAQSAGRAPAWVRARRCLPASDSLGSGGGRWEGGTGEAVRSWDRRLPPDRDSTAQPELRAAFLRWVGDGLKCLRPGARPEPRGRGDHDAAAGDPQPARGGGFRRGWAAAVSELPGQRASEPGASPSLGPRRLLLCPPSSLSGPGRAALVVGLPVESFFGPQRGETCPNWGAL